MQQASLFMMIHPNGLEYATRSSLPRRQQSIEPPNNTTGLSANTLECTPKDAISGKQKRGKDSSHRAGDWICNVCNNHNYSFREVCNSCKTQTKIDNLKQSLSVLTNPTMTAVEFPKQPSNKKRLQLKRGQEFEPVSKDKQQFQKGSVDSQNNSPAGQLVPVERPLIQAFEDSFSEFLFEKAVFAETKDNSWNHDSEEPPETEDSIDLDKETLKILSFCQE